MPGQLDRRGVIGVYILDRPVKSRRRRHLPQRRSGTVRRVLRPSLLAPEPAQAGSTEGTTVQSLMRLECPWCLGAEEPALSGLLHRRQGNVAIFDHLLGDFEILYSLLAGQVIHQ